MNEEDIKFQKHLALMQQRGAMRTALNEAVKRFNEWNEENFPGQFLPMQLAVKDRYGLRGIHVEHS